MTNLAELVPEEAILVDVDVDGRDALITAMSKALADAGIVECDYAGRCIERERTSPTGLVTAAGNIALPHADPRDGERMGIAVARPAAPVEFGAMADDGTVDAEVVFLLAVAGGEAHLDTLAAVIDLVQDTDQMTELLTAKAPEDIRRVLRRNPE